MEVFSCFCAILLRPFCCYSNSFTVARVVDEYPTDLLSDSIIHLVLLYAHMLYISLKTHICPWTSQKILSHSVALSVEDIISCSTYYFACFLSARLMYSCSFLKPSEILQVVLTSQLIEIILPSLFIYLFIFVFFWPFLQFFSPWLSSVICLEIFLSY